jgi:hypothetical protein
LLNILKTSTRDQFMQNINVHILSSSVIERSEGFEPINAPVVYRGRTWGTTTTKNYILERHNGEEPPKLMKH